MQRTRLSTAWTVAAIGVLVLVAVLIFILENLRTTETAFLGVHWRIPLGLDLLLAALLGAGAVLAIGVGRILQLRLVARRQNQPQAADRADSESAEPNNHSKMSASKVR